LPQETLGLILNWVDNATRLQEQNLFVSRTVKEWLWGWDDPILESLSEIFPTDLTSSGRFPGFGKNMSNLKESFKTGYNGIYSGSIDKESMRQYFCYHSLEGSVDFWNSDSANEIWGTDGYQFQNGINIDQDDLYVWDEDSVRYVKNQVSSN
jgi:hypothetical protein